MATTPFTIPAQTITSPLVVNGTTVQLSIVVPAQTVQLPASGGGTGSLPAGLTWTNSVLAVAGSITATQITLSGGPALPASSTGLYVLQLVNGALQPVAYPPITALSPSANTLTIKNT
jgi:hypothetical protein